MISKQKTKDQALQDAKHFTFKSQKTEMFVTFFNSGGIIHKEFVPPGHMVNKEYYVKVLSHLVQRIHRVRPQFQERGSWFHLHDSATPHTAVSVQQFLAKQGIPELTDPPYSPDLSPPDFFLFPQIKSTPKGRRLEDTKDIKRNVTKKLLALDTNEFKKCFQRFCEQAGKGVTSQGVYFEEY
jgi:histone-lysine N-methyltransferase SETMAR